MRGTRAHRGGQGRASNSGQVREAARRAWREGWQARRARLRAPRCAGIASPHTGPHASRSSTHQPDETVTFRLHQGAFGPACAAPSRCPSLLKHVGLLQLSKLHRLPALAAGPAPCPATCFGAAGLPHRCCTRRRLGSASSLAAALSSKSCASSRGLTLAAGGATGESACAALCCGLHPQPPQRVFEVLPLRLQPCQALPHHRLLKGVASMGSRQGRPPAFKNILLPLLCRLLPLLPLLLLLLLLLFMLLQGVDSGANCVQLTLHGTQLLLQGSRVQAGIGGDGSWRLPSCLGLRWARHGNTSCQVDAIKAA